MTADEYPAPQRVGLLGFYEDQTRALLDRLDVIALERNWAEDAALLGTDPAALWALHIPGQEMTDRIMRALCRLDVDAWDAADRRPTRADTRDFANEVADGVAFRSRMTDPGTSDIAADTVNEREGHHDTIRPDTHKARLLIAYGRSLGSGGDGRKIALTDEEAAELADLDAGAWKRCSDLRTGGWIAPHSERQGTSGVPVMACVITEKGWARWQELDTRAVRGPMPTIPPPGLF